MSGKYLFVSTAHVVFGILIFQLIVSLLPSTLLYRITCVEGCVECVLVIFASFILTKRLFLNGKVDSSNKAVLITGCDSGFGHFLAKRLDSLGFRVFAGCLLPDGEGATDLKESCSQRLQTLGLDVTKDGSVRKALELVEEKLDSCELWAVVNNAGIAKGFSVEFSSIQDFKDCMEVNTFGMLRVTKSFLPLIRMSKGRIVNVTSNSGRIPLPHITPYCVSKFAATGLNDCLRQEIGALGVQVIAVEPEMFRTPITNEDLVNKRFELTLSSIEENVRSGYGENYLERLKKIKDCYLKNTSTNVDLVINDLISAVTLEYPDVIYRTRHHLLSQIILLFYQIMPSCVQDFVYRLLWLFVSFS